MQTYVDKSFTKTKTLENYEYYWRYLCIAPGATWWRVLCFSTVAAGLPAGIEQIHV